MELRLAKKIREEYLKLLSGYKEYNGILSSLSKRDKKEPIFSPEKLEPENVPDYDTEQRNLSEITLDMKSINASLVEIEKRLDKIMQTVDMTEKDALDNINKEEQRVSDINMICNISTDYNMCIPIYYDDFEKKNSAEIIDNDTIGANLISKNEVEYFIADVKGNGYEGNAYVYNDKGEEEQVLENRSNYDFILDENDSTFYEYSRLNTDSKDEAVDGLINYDEKEVSCVITFATKEPVCRMMFMSDDDDIVIENLEISSDNVNFYPVLKKPVRINDMNKVYNDISYTYGSRTLCFPYCTVIRLTVTSNSVLDDIIKVKDENGGFLKTENTRRKRIKINKVLFYKGQYGIADILTKDMLKGGSVDKIALFVNEYVPDHFSSDDYVEYSLIINGKEYKIVPVNSDREGTKIIRFAKKEDKIKKDWYTETVNETIKTAQVKIIIKPFKGKETPYVSNLKLCLGKDTGSIYV